MSDLKANFGIKGSKVVSLIIHAQNRKGEVDFQ